LGVFYLIFFVGGVMDVAASDSDRIQLSHEEASSLLYLWAAPCHEELAMARLNNCNMEGSVQEQYRSKDHSNSHQGGCTVYIALNFILVL